MKLSLLTAFLLCVSLRLEAAPLSLDAQLLQATKNGNSVLVQALLKRGAHVNVRDATGATSLILAAQHDDMASMDVLLKNGANIRARDNWGMSCVGYSPRFAEQLVKRGGVTTRNDAVALSDWLEGDVWIDSDVDDDEVRTEAQMLMRAGMNLNTRGFDENQTTPLMAAVESRPSLVPFFLSLGADPNVADGQGRTPLTATLSLFPISNPLNIVDDKVAFLLLQHGAKVNTRGQDGTTALMLAADSNLLALARELIKRGANTNIRDDQGGTALMRAASSGHSTMVRLLLASGALSGLQNNKGIAALDFARRGDIVFESIGIVSTPPQKDVDSATERILKGRKEIEQVLEGKK